MQKILFLFFILAFFSCTQKDDEKNFHPNKRTDFKPETYGLKNMDVKLVRGQILYMPVYSNLPKYKDSAKFDMSAFVAFHNTDFYGKIKLKKVQYFDSKGKMVHDFLNDQIKEIGPLETADFYVPYHDKGGTGANFLIEWMSDSLVSEPLVESVTVSLKNYNSIAVLSQGKVIKEIR